MSPNFSVPETAQLGISPPGIERYRPQDLKSAIKTKQRLLFFIKITFLGLGGGLGAGHMGSISSFVSAWRVCTGAQKQLEEHVKRCMAAAGG